MNGLTQIRLDNVTVELDGNEILTSVSLSFHSNEISCLLGPNGSGKSVLGKTMCFLHRVKTGGIFWNNRNVANPRSKEKEFIQMRKQTSYIWQDAYFTSGNVLSNLETPLKIRGVLRETRKKKIDSITKTLEVKNLLHADPKTLSGGQQQKISLIRGIITEPKLLILDEATNALDIESSKWFEQFILNYMKENNVIIIWITHNLFLAQRVSNVINVLRDGEIMFRGSYQHLVKTNKFLNLDQFLNYNL